MASGGKREGAGRPRIANNVAITVRIDKGIADEIRNLAKTLNIPIGKVIESFFAKR